jgi:multimeric flavodoxin WrbA
VAGCFIWRNVLKIIVHDLNENDFSTLGITDDDFEMINANKPSAPCMGCFHCWVKTPGTCKINDGLKNIGSLMGNSEEIVLISQNCYGGYSEPVKKVIDRGISTSLPFFTYRSGKMRHRRRYNIGLKRLTVFLYGDFLETEKSTAQLIVEANRSNMDCHNADLHIIKHFNEVREFFK